MREEKKDNLFSKFVKFILKDTSGENESKKLVLLVRIIVLSLLVYLVISGIIYIDLLNVSGIVLYFLFLTVFIFLFFTTYHLKTYTILILFDCNMLIWIIASIRYFGWNIGVQHYIIFLFILGFFSSYQHTAIKMAYGTFLCAFRILLYFICLEMKPIIALSDRISGLLQLINTFFIFWCIGLLCYIFSRDAKNLEGKLVAYNEQLREQASTDSLTKLYNRRKAMEYLSGLSKDFMLNRGFSICICDIDYFKRINDNYGHDFGDIVLREVAGIIKEEMKDRGLVARWGGEEFLLIFSKDNGDEAFIILEKIRWKIKKYHFDEKDKNVNVTMTFGLAEYDFANGIDFTIKEADKKLYIGKEAGRDRIIF